MLNSPLLWLALTCLVATAECRRTVLLKDVPNTDCTPEDLPERDRCQYVLDNAEACAPRSGMLNYLHIYYCFGLQFADPLAILLVVAWIAVLFMFMFIASDRFFCPALELISEYLRLSPAVAGATLLSFGNGAPDVFTQISAIQAGMGPTGVAPEAVSMALSEPLGTGLFVCNVVLGLAVAAARSMQEVVLHKRAFFKDVGCYLAALLIVSYCLVVGKVHLWQAGILVALYIFYVFTTISLSAKDEVVHLDPLMHEVPRLVPYGPWDDLDSDEVEAWDWLEALPSDLRTDSGIGYAAGATPAVDVPGQQRRAFAIRRGVRAPSWRQRASILSGRNVGRTVGSNELRHNWADPSAWDAWQSGRPWGGKGAPAAQQRRSEPGSQAVSVRGSRGHSGAENDPFLSSSLSRPHLALSKHSRKSDAGNQVGPLHRQEDAGMDSNCDDEVVGVASAPEPGHHLWLMVEQEEADAAESGGWDINGSPSGTDHMPHHSRTLPHSAPSETYTLADLEAAMEEEERQHMRLDWCVPSPSKMPPSRKGTAEAERGAAPFSVPCDTSSESSLSTSPGASRGKATTDSSPPTSQDGSPGKATIGMTRIPSLLRMPSQRQAEGLATLVKSVSSRFRSDSGCPDASGTSPGGGSPRSGLGGSPPQSGFQSPGGMVRSASMRWEGPDEHVYVPLLLQGKLSELEAALAQHEQGSRNSKVAAGGSPPACSISPLEEDEDDSLWATGSLRSEGGVGSFGGLGMDARRELTSKEMQAEQKRLKKLLYYGHKQAQAQKGTAGAEQGPSMAAGLDAGASSPTTSHVPLPTTALGCPISSSTPGGAATTLGSSIARPPSFGTNLSQASLATAGRWRSGNTGATGVKFSLSGGGHYDQPSLTSQPSHSTVHVGPCSVDASLGVPLLQDDRGNTGGVPGGTGWAGGSGEGFMQGVEAGMQGLNTGGNAVGDVDAIRMEGLYAELDQQAEAALRKRQERHEASRVKWWWLMWRALRRPVVTILCLTMPAMGRSQELYWAKPYAVVAPIVGPLVLAVTGGWVRLSPQGGASSDIPGGILAGLAMFFMALSLAAILLYPPNGRLQGTLLGVCTVITFVGSMQWINTVADELVGLLAAVGNIMDIPAALLSSTVLAWGNSLSDLVSNTSLARDGYPTMALTACFASPLFILLAGMSCTLVFGSAVSGELLMPKDAPTRMLYATSIVNMVMWGIVVPMLRFRLDRRITILGFIFYAAFQVGFVGLTVHDRPNKAS